MERTSIMNSVHNILREEQRTRRINKFWAFMDRVTPGIKSCVAYMVISLGLMTVMFPRAVQFTALGLYAFVAVCMIWRMWVDHKIWMRKLGIEELKF